MSEYEKEFKDIYDDIMERDSFAVLSTDEPYAPDKLNFKDFCLYPFKSDNLFFTISIFGVGLILTNTFIGFIFAIFLNILYGIYLMRKILNIKETFTADAHLLIFFLYLFIINTISWTLILYAFDLIAQKFLSHSQYFLLSHDYDGGGIFENMFTPILSYTNILFCSGFIITFTIAENRPFYTYLKYKKELTFYNTITGFCLFGVFITGLNILSINIHSDVLRTFITVMINLCSSYVILISLLSWTTFLRKDLYPEIKNEKEEE